MRKTFALLLTVALLAVTVAVHTRSADQADGLPDYQPVAGWPRLPEGFKFGAVTAVATDAADNLWVFHRGKGPIALFDKDGKHVRSFGDGLVKTAHGLRLDRDGNVWTTDIGNHLVRKFSREGKLLLTLGKENQPGDTPDTFNKPADIAFTPAGQLYVADGYGNSRVVKFSKEGKYLKEWGKKGKGEGEFNLPHAVVLDDKGQVWVGDRENNRVQVFDGEGKFLFQWKESGAPYGLFLGGGNKLYVADGRGNRVNILAESKVLGRFGEKGVGPGQFALPHGICLDSKGAIYVGEVGNQRLQKFVAK